MSEENKEVVAEGTPVAFWFEEKSVENVEVLDEKTPLGQPIYKVTFGNGFGDPQVMTAKKFSAVRTLEKSDATSARERLVKKLGSELYALMVEYGLKFSEIDPCLNEVVRLANDGQNLANDHLWGNSMYDRSLLDVNRVLLSKYGAETTEKEGAGDDGASSDGSAPTTANPQ